MGRDKRNERRVEHYTQMIRTTMETPAWRALSKTAQALYPWIKLEWRGPKANNNGRLRLSVRDAATRIGVGTDTAARAFHDLQAKGFLIVTEAARLGLSGEAKSPTYELTELALPNGADRSGRKLYRRWSPGHDFPVAKAMANNPSGRNRKNKTLSSKSGRDVIEIGTFRGSTS